MKTIGILAFQGGVIEHQTIIKKLGSHSLLVHSKKDLAKIDALIIPGGESTTIGFFLESTGLNEAIKKHATQKKSPLPIWGTCAGAIVMAKKIISDKIPPHLELMDITIERNAYGSQLESFYAEIKISLLHINNLKAAFIRAPIITKIGPNVKILAQHDKKIALVQQGKLLASTFHPELRDESRLHEYFIDLINKE